MTETAHFRVQWPVTRPQLAARQGPPDTFLHSQAVLVGRTVKLSLGRLGGRGQGEGEEKENNKGIVVLMNMNMPVVIL